jgi:putative chromate ion transporter
LFYFACSVDGGGTGLGVSEVWPIAASGRAAVWNQAGGGSADHSCVVEPGEDGAKKHPSGEVGDWRRGAFVNETEWDLASDCFWDLWVVVQEARKSANLDAASIAATSLFSLEMVGSLPLFLYFLKIGAVVFGSGYVLLAVLRADLVVHRHSLTDAQLLDAIAVSQATPGPFFTVARFIGHLLGGWRGAALATVGMFLPAFVYVAATAKLLSRLRKSPIASDFLDGVNAAAVALMATVSWRFARAALVNGPAVALGLVSLVLVFRYRVNSAWLVLGGATAGILLHSFFWN